MSASATAFKPTVKAGGPLPSPGGAVLLLDVPAQNRGRGASCRCLVNVMRYRLAAQGNGQAALGHGAVADPATLDVSPPRAVPETR